VNVIFSSIYLLIQQSPRARSLDRLPEQDAKYEVDVWDETINAYLVTKQTVTISQVARDALGIETKRIGTGDQNRVRKVMEHLG
jgi:hypothetical protein